MAETLGASLVVQKPLSRGREPQKVRSNMQKRSGATTRRGAEKDFPNDEERYAWEVNQRFFHMDRMDRWLAADGVHTIGPPLPPGATVFFGVDPTKTFEEATKAGYIAVRPAAEKLGVSRRTVRGMIDRLPELDVAYVVYMGKKRNSRYHCRMIQKRSVRVVKRDVRKWMKEANKNGKKTKPKNIRRDS
jgi:GNAT superfamily N-acetyltransferase